MVDDPRTFADKARVAHPLVGKESDQVLVGVFHRQIVERPDHGSALGFQTRDRSLYIS